ncbi:MAG: hypothetical protein EOL97_15100 [Spirochaetia bacterium]|nr:hypothetical protein [Spirochaetia bacterium]
MVKKEIELSKSELALNEINLKGKKKAFYLSMIKNLGNIAKSCIEIGISRELHYYWKRTDPVYKQYIDNINDYQLDFYENALHILIQDKNPSATIFALKCKGKSRGWVEKNEIELSGGVENTLNADAFFMAWNKVNKKEEKDDEFS